MMEPNKLGMLFFLSSEAIFFALLIFAYLYFADSFAETGPTPEVLDVGVTAIFSVLLLASSVTIWFAERSLRRGNNGMMRLWLLVTILLGAVFLVGQAMEYATLFSEGITISRGLFGTTFFTLTGFHGLHVLGGLVALIILLMLAKSLRGPHSRALETTSLYWHFVDLVWIAVFSVVYLGALFL